MPMPIVKAGTISDITLSAVNADTFTVDRELIEQWIDDVDKSNPEIAGYIARTSDMIRMIETFDQKPEWYVIVAMVIMYKAIEDTIDGA